MMIEEELIKKLEETKVPDIEISNHRMNLRRLLLSRYQAEQKKEWVSVFLKPALAMSFTFLALLGLVFNASIFSPPDEITAKEIALQNPQFKSLIDKGAIIREVELAGNKSYLLLRWQEPRKKAGQGLKQESTGVAKMETIAPSMLKTTTDFLEAAPAKEANFLVEIDFKTKKVSEMRELPVSTLPFTAEEEQLIKKISEESKILKRQIPANAKIQEIKAVFLQFNLIKNENEVEAILSKNAEVIYKDDGNIWKSKINLDRAEVETVEFLGAKTQP